MIVLSEIFLQVFMMALVVLKHMEVPDAVSHDPNILPK
jgi:hypothetical protein